MSTKAKKKKNHLQEVSVPSLKEKLKELAAMQEGILSLEQEKVHALKDYQAKVKEYLGFEDGKPLNIVELATLIDKVTG